MTATSQNYLVPQAQIQESSFPAGGPYCVSGADGVDPVTVVEEGGRGGQEKSDVKKTIIWGGHCGAAG